MPFYVCSVCLLFVAVCDLRVLSCVRVCVVRCSCFVCCVFVGCWLRLVFGALVSWCLLFDVCSLLLVV